MMNDRGNAWVVMVGLVSLAVVAVSFAMLSELEHQIYDMGINQSWYSGEAADTLNFLDMIWKKWPIVATITILVWMIAASIRKREENIYMR
tara:strand:- start:548 stop:820 length:273 start_codon:yes stop_codon:yes gene_type:complete